MAEKFSFCHCAAAPSPQGTVFSAAQGGYRTGSVRMYGLRPGGMADVPLCIRVAAVSTGHPPQIAGTHFINQCRHALGFRLLPQAVGFGSEQLRRLQKPPTPCGLLMRLAFRLFAASGLRHGFKRFQAAARLWPDCLRVLFSGHVAALIRLSGSLKPFIPPYTVCFMMAGISHVSARTASACGKMAAASCLGS